MWLLLCFQLIDLSMSVSDDPKEPYFFSVLPWIILYRIIKHEEAAFDCMLRQHMSIGDDEGLLTSFVSSVFRWCRGICYSEWPRQVSFSDDSDTPMLPSSLMLLNTAHEYLGRRSLCCNSDGTLLKFFVSCLWDQCWPCWCAAVQLAMYCIFNLRRNCNNYSTILYSTLSI